MPVVDKITTVLDAETNKFNAGIGKAEKRVKGFSGNVKRNVKGISKALDGINFGKIGVAITAVSATASLLSKNVISAATDIHRLSLRTGVTASELSKLNFIASQAGIEFDTLSDALKDMNIRLAEASSGSGEAVEALEFLNIDPQGLLSQDGVTTFTMFIDKLKDVPSAAKQAELAEKLFGEAGVGLLQIVNDQNLSLEETIKLGERLGVVLTDEAARAANETTKAFNLLWSGIKGIGVGALNSYSDTITRAGNALKEATENGDEFSVAMSRVWDAIFNDQGNEEPLTGLAAAAKELKEAELEVSRAEVERNARRARFEQAGVGGNFGDTVKGAASVRRILSARENRNIKQLAFERARAADDARKEAEQRQRVASFGAQAGDQIVPGIGGGPSSLALREGLMRQQEIDERKIEKAQELKDSLILIEEEKTAKMREELQRRADDGDLFAQMEIDRQDFVNASWNKKLSAMSGAFSQFTSALANENKTLFAINKAFALSDIAINTAQAAMKAYAILGPIAGPVAAGGITALGARLAHEVAAQSFGGGGSSSGGGANLGALVGSQSERVTNINVDISGLGEYFDVDALTDNIISRVESTGRTDLVIRR